ncbi:MULTISPECIES: hypothetical protein [Sphingobacterium]|jgi:hypothetical protein|uniref:hypothetical protein n=1 Tax=Sphingobacterium TaxID=28453 RepID=UPI0006279257|nr:MULTISPECIES: hypothetical protein [Sphingobacterium]KKO89335.1 hypothetical protein AAW12_24945 [Sphingobacterium sp. Ag1]MDF2850993.1 hypothetical protein [Sphingobacterium multivorum]
MPKETRTGLYQGIIEKDDNGNYFCGPFLLDYQTVETYYKLGDRVSIKTIIKNTSRKSMEAYPQKSVKFSYASEDHGND